MKEKDAAQCRDGLQGISRRDFMKFCSVMAVSLGLPVEMAPRIANAITSPHRPPVIWLSGQACTGCIETTLRANHPTLAHLILDLISLEYCETLNAGSGHQAEEFLAKSIAENEGKFLLLVDGAIPVKDGGIYCKIGGKTMLDILKEIAPKAAAVISTGSCSSWGGIPSALPNPTGATPVHKVLEGSGIVVVNVPGCPPNSYNILATILHYLTLKRLPDLDHKLRPKFAYGRLIHESCERRPHFDAGRFAETFGDEGHRKGYCLYKLGCKGPETFNNCPAVLFCDVGSGAWPVGTGHPCFGCSEDGVGFFTPLHSPAKPLYITPPTQFANAKPPESSGASALAAGVAGAAIGAAVVAIGISFGKKDHGGESEED
jgi:hydrogenase small subunit